MNNDPSLDVAVFTEAIDLPESERSAFLDRACGDNIALRRRVEGLLRVYDSAGDFLEKPLPPTIYAGPEDLVGERPGDLIGRYKLLQKIGEGGCGVVYKAEQSIPVRRLIALKVIRPGMDTRSVIARFEAERQALALMDHPHIAKVFDAGATESGRPFFVMELVKGVKITDYCGQHSLKTEDRLRLFVLVCQAIQHAHQKGVIHRDIKPSNILVTKTEGGVAVPIVIDFGIAKATTNQPLADNTVFTAFEMLIGTPAYMSPEQAGLRGVDADTRTDIYSLGVLLYELLTGSTPFGRDMKAKLDLDEIRRVIREKEPIRPSILLKSMPPEELAAAASGCRSTPTVLIRSIEGDLDWITMKALEKDRSRRYETVNGLVLDVQRHLSNEPILARPPSRFYKLQKLVLRNKLLFVAIGVVAILLLASLALMARLMEKERQARFYAQTQAARSQQISRLLEDMLQSVDPAVARGQDTTLLHGILDQTAQQLGSEMTNQPAVQAELLGLIGRVYVEIGDFGQAQQMQQTALTINQKLYGQNSLEVAASLNDLGWALTRDQNWVAGLPYLEQSLALRQRFGAKNADLADSLDNVAEVYTQLGKINEAETLCRQGLVIREELFTRNDLRTAESLRSLGIILGDKGSWVEAEEKEREVLAIRRELLKHDDPRVATALTDVAWAAGANGKLAEAESLEREALEIRRRVLRPDHPDIAKSLYLVGDRLSQRGKLAEAYTFLNEALSMQRSEGESDNPNLLDTLHSLAQVLEADGKMAQAEQVHREALALWRKRGEAGLPQALSEAGNLAKLLMNQRRIVEARQVLDDALSPEVMKQPSSSELLDLRINIEGHRSQWQEACADAFQSFENQPLNSGRYAAVAALLIKAHDNKRYEEFYKRVYALYGNTTNIFVADLVAKVCLFGTPSEVDLKAIDRLADLTVIEGASNEGAMPFFEGDKALSEYRLGHFAEAAKWAQRAFDSPREEANWYASGVLAMADWRLGKSDEARSMLAKGNNWAPSIMPANIADDNGGTWLSWLFARIQLDEATALISPGLEAGTNSDEAASSQMNAKP